MPSPPSPEPKSPRRGWIAFGLKAAIAVAALTSLAQWIPRKGGGTDESRREASLPPPVRAEVADPAMTGSLGPRSRPVAAAAAPAQPGAFDQRGLTSLITQTQVEPAKPAKKR